MQHPIKTCRQECRNTTHLTNEFRIPRRFTLRTISHHLPWFRPFIFFPVNVNPTTLRKWKTKKEVTFPLKYFMKGPYLYVLSTAPPKSVNYFQTHVISHFKGKAVYNTTVLTPWGALQPGRLICSCGHSIQKLVVKDSDPLRKQQSFEASFALRVSVSTKKMVIHWQ